MKIRNIIGALCLTVALAIGFNLPGARFVAAQGFDYIVRLGASSSPSIAAINNPTVGLYFNTKGVGVTKHLMTGLASTDNLPVLTSCGTTPTIVGNDAAGTVTMGTTATGCVITFGTAYAAAPVCTVTWIATPLASQSYVTSASAITTTQTSTSNNVLKYICVGLADG